MWGMMSPYCWRYSDKDKMVACEEAVQRIQVIERQVDEMTIKVSFY